MSSIEEKDVGQPSCFHFPPSFTLTLLPGHFYHELAGMHSSGDASNESVTQS